jgi:alkaline phosphatase/2',3'-cyclic-nucleotide 2'-phosphodiesterase (5'-nucleotidase family)/3',5'-cyclic AMP phosphodiesterase CpdA/methionine-rich copper-binding protein CopC
MSLTGFNESGYLQELLSRLQDIQSVTAKISVISDPHYFDPSLGTSGAAFDAYLSSDRKMIAESDAILKSAIAMIKADNPDILLIPGDLTKDGEKVSHETFAAYLAELENSGIKVYVIPGNHDVNNPDAMRYDGDTATPIASVTPEEFREIYSDFGYGDALYRDSASLSYVAAVSGKLWILALDSCEYEQNDTDPETSGSLSAETKAWALEKLAEAKLQGITVIGMMHHSLSEHFTLQADLFSEYVVENSAVLAEEFAVAGLSVMFTGHFHANDVNTISGITSDGEPFGMTEIETGSLVTWPSPVRTVNLSGGSMDISSSSVTDIDYDLGDAASFVEYATNYLMSGLNQIAVSYLMGSFGVSADAAAQVAPLFAAAMAAHYNGDENPDAVTLGTIQALAASGDAIKVMLAGALQSLWTDGLPADNDLTAALNNFWSDKTTDDLRQILGDEYDLTPEQHYLLSQDDYVMTYTPYAGTGEGSSDASTALSLDEEWMIVADDEVNILRVYPRNGGAAVLEWSYEDNGPKLTKELDLEASTMVGNTIYLIGSHSNKKDGADAEADRSHLFAVTVTGTGASTQFSYVGQFTELESELVVWDSSNGHGLGADYFGFATSAAAGIEPERVDGFSIEGLVTSPDESELWLAFRSPQSDSAERDMALIVPVTNYPELIAGTAGDAVFGDPVQLDLGGRGIRSISRSEGGDYLIIAGPSGTQSDAVDRDFALFTWDGQYTHQPVELSNNLDELLDATGGSFESIADLSSSLTTAGFAQLLMDNGDTIWPGETVISKDLPEDKQQFEGFWVQLQSALSDTHGPILKSATPTDNTPGIDVESSIVLTFNEGIERGTGNIVLHKADGSVVETFDVSDSDRVVFDYNILAIDPTSSLDYGTGYYLTIAAGAISDHYGNGYSGINSVSRLNFTTTAGLPSVLAAGDILFVGGNAEAPDAIAFALLKDINGGTQITFTDRDYKTTTGFAGIVNEAAFVWTADKDYAAGTIVTIQTDTVGSPLADKGTTFGGGGGVGKAETYYAFQGGSIASLEDGSAGEITSAGTFLASLTLGGKAGDIPAELTTAGSAFSFTVSPAKQTNALYVGSHDAANIEDFADRIKDTEHNWIAHYTQAPGFPLSVDGSLFGPTLLNNGAKGWGDSIMLSFDNPPDIDHLPTVDQFAVDNGGNVTITSLQVIDNQIVLKLAAPIDNSKPVSVSYTDRTSADDDLTVQDENGVDAPSFRNVEVTKAYTLQLLHFSDAEAGLLASETAPNLAALVDKFEDEFSSSITLSGGDNFIPGPFLAAGTDGSVIDELNAVTGSTLASNATVPIGAVDIALQSVIGVEASAIGNHEFDLGSNVLGGAFKTTASYKGAQFPYITANLDFSSDNDLKSSYVDTTATTGLERADSLKGKIAPSAILVENGEMIGLVGATTQILEAISSPSGTEVEGFPTGTGSDGEADNMDLLAAQLQPVINDLRDQGVNKIILISHLQLLGNEKLLATKLSGVDIIVSGGSHTRLGDDDDEAVALPGHSAEFSDTYPLILDDMDGNTTLIVTTDNEFSYLGRLVVDFDENGNILVDSLADNTGINGAYAATEERVAEAWGVTVDELDSTAFADGTRGSAVKTLTDAVKEVIDVKDGNVYGYSDVYLEGERIAVRSEETNLGDLSADANAYAAELALGDQAEQTFIVSLKNGGGIRAQIGTISAPDPLDGTVEKLPPPDGSVSQLDVENSLRFNNQLMVFDTTPEGLKAILEHGVAAGTLQGRFPQLGGVSFSWDPDLPAGSRVSDIALISDEYRINLYNDGTKLDTAPETISLVTLSYLANGGDNYPMKAHGENFRYITLQTDGSYALSAPVDESLNFTLQASVPGGATVLGEQSALETYMEEFHATPDTAFDQADTSVSLDTRIQNLNERDEAVLASSKLVLLGSIALPGAEITAYHEETNMAFVIGGDDEMYVVDLSNPANPVLLHTVTLAGNAQSVAVNAEGLIAVAVDKEATVPGSSATYHDSGLVQFFTMSGSSIVSAGQVTVGSLPDSITFNENGTLLVTANEGEPNTFYTTEEDSMDPVGSISIIEVNGAHPASSAVTTLTFDAYNGQLEQLRNKGVRISGDDDADGITGNLVAQDMEPEYVSISGSKAYVTLQENNAVAVVDLTTKKISAIYPAGLKDWDRGTPEATSYELTLEYPGDRPDFDNDGAVDNGEVVAGGLSGLWYEGKESVDGVEYDIYYTITDRGPQAFAIGDRANDNPNDPAKGEKVFEDPDFPITVYKLGMANGAVVELGSTTLKVPDGSGGFRDSTGLGMLDRNDKAYVHDGMENGYNAYSLMGKDQFGLDSECVLRLQIDDLNNGDPVFAVADEYGPQIAIFDAVSGNLIKRIVPAETDFAAAADIDYADVPSYTSETLPEVYSTIFNNRGFEAMAYNSSDGLLYTFVQSPLHPDGYSNQEVTRIIAVDPITGEAKHEYLYSLTGEKGQDKIGDAVYDAERDVFYVIERDSGTTSNANKTIFEISLNGATDTLDYTLGNNGRSWEQLLGDGITQPELSTEKSIADTLDSISFVNKNELLNLPSLGIDPRFDKAEGLALKPDGTLVVGFDNDFIHVDGRADNVLVEISFDELAVDTSDKDGGIASGHRPFYGMRMPDGIDTYQYNGETFLVMANEGDGRIRPDAVNFVVDAEYDGEYLKMVSDLPVSATLVETLTDPLTKEDLYIIVSDSSDPDAYEVAEEDEYFLTIKYGWKSDDFFYSDETRLVDYGDLDKLNDYIQEEGGKKGEIGRLKTVNTEVYLSDDALADGSPEQVIGFGGRSISIMDSKGNIVYDSGDLIEQAAIHAGVYDDSRSDDKGTEPENVTLAEVGGQIYAYVALERANSIAVFDVTDPYHVSFVELVDVAADTGFLSPEGLVTGDGLLIVSHEVEKGLAVYALADVPMLAEALVDVSTAEDEKFRHVVLADTFAEVGAGDTLTYTATLADGSALPDWLKFDASSHSLETMEEYFLSGGSSALRSTDSASAITAIVTGEKTDAGNISWKSGDPVNGEITTIAETLRAEKGFAIGVASTVPFSHATPAGVVSHDVNRGNTWDISHEILFDTQPEVVIGGGLDSYFAKATKDAAKTDRDLDDNGLNDEYDAFHAGTDGTDYVFVERTTGADGGDALLSAASGVKLAEGEKLFGLFGTSGGNFEYYEVADNPGDPDITRSTGDSTPTVDEDPTLEEVTNAALSVLNQDEDGFFVMIEQGDIDWSNHANDYENMVGGVYDLDKAVIAAETFVETGSNGIDWSNTLLIVTSDHSNSYLRAQEELGLGDLPAQSGMSYPDGEVTYGTTGHTNELVTVSARGAGAELFAAYAGEIYAGTDIVDNTQIYEVMKEAAETAGAEHIILMIGDGMNVEHEIAGSRYLYGEEFGLAWQDWGTLEDGWTGYASTWDVSSYNYMAALEGAAPYTEGSFTSTIGYDPAQGGTTPYPVAMTFSGTPTNGDVGSLDIKVTATDENGATVSDVFTLTVTNTNDAPTGSVTVTGRAIEGETLTAENTLADQDGLGSISYQWQADGVDIIGAQGQSLVLGAQEKDKRISVVASYKDGHGTNESAGSNSILYGTTTSISTDGSLITTTIPVETLADLSNELRDLLDFSDPDIAANPDILAGIDAFEGSLGEGSDVEVRLLTFTSDPENPAQPISITGSSSAHEALVIDARNLPPGTELDLHDVEFAVIIGEHITIRGGEGANIVYAGGAGSQDMVLGSDDDELHGGDGDDYVGSVEGNDTLYGDAGNDTLKGGPGNDSLDGGEGNDTVEYTGNFDDYTISYDEASDRYTIVDKTADRDGTDHVTGFEHFRFADGTKEDIIDPTVKAFNPGDGAGGIAVNENMVITFSEAIQRGSGTIAIHAGSPDGPVVESYNVMTSPNLTISESRLTINPTADLASGTHYYVSFGEGCVKDLAGNSYAGTSGYDFSTADPYAGHNDFSDGGVDAGVILAGVGALGVVAWLVF